MSEKFYVGERLVDFRDIKREKPVRKITLLWDEEHGFSAGTADGLELTAECYFATAEIAERVRAELDGLEYHAFSAVGADIDPAAEPGDGVTACGVYSTLARYADDGSGYPDLEAPGEAELEEEFPVQGPLTQQIKQKVTLGTAYEGVRISRANGLEVVKTLEDGSERARAQLKSDRLAFYDDNGGEALYFDPNIGRYIFRGDVVIDGNIRMGAGQITWTDGGIDSGISAWEAQTIIDRTLVSSPNIAGGRFWDINQRSWLSMEHTAVGEQLFSHLFINSNFTAGFGEVDRVLLEIVGRSSLDGSAEGIALSAGYFKFLDVDITSGWPTTQAHGNWDFGSANVSGLYLRYA